MPESSGRMISLSAGEKKGAGYLSQAKSIKGGVLVLHAWWGLNDFFKQLCDRLAAEGYTALAPDLRQGKIAKTVEEAKDLMSQIDEETTFPPIVLAGFDFLKSQPGLKGYPIGVIGFSMGASWALWLSAERPSDVKAVVTFYGAWAGNWDFSKGHASYLGHYSPEDEWEPIDGVRSLETKLKSAGRPVEFHYYPGTKHWFMEDNRPEYDRKESVLAWTRTLDFLHKNLR